MVKMGQKKDILYTYNIQTVDFLKRALKFGQYRLWKAVNRIKIL